MKVYLQIMSYCNNYYKSIIVSFIASIFFGIFNGLSIWMVSSLIGTIMNSNDIGSIGSNDGSLNSILETYINGLIYSQSPIDQLKLVCLFLFIAFVFKNIFFYINQTLLSYVQLNVIKDIRNKLYTKIQNLPLDFFDKSKSGELLSILLNDITSIRVAFTKSFQIIFSELMNVVFLLVMLFIISKKLTIVVFAAIPISGYIIIKIGKSIRRKATRSSYKIADISNLAQETIMGVKIIKAFNMKKNEVKNFVKENFIFSDLLYKQAKLFNLSTPINDFIGITIAIILLWFGGKEVLENNSISSDGFIRYIMFLFAMLQPSRRLGSGIAAIQTGIASAKRVNSILDLEDVNVNDNNLINIDNFNDKINFQNVSFQYQNANQYALKNINVIINKGETVALVGKSGSGKTTFSNLLLRFYNPTEGKITIDNQDFEIFNKSSLRDIMSIVTQEPILFNDSIKNNIAYGSNEINEDLVISSASTANADSFINLLDDKYESIIGERGTKLSGGEKQRLSIARAIYRNPEILILDEATSSLDSESEKLVQQAIDNLIIDRTVVIIAHRLSTIINCDKILVFDNGEIVESGNHNELLKLGGFYKKLYDLQFGSN